MATLATNIVTGTADHPGLHNAERVEINALQTGKLATTALTSSNLDYTTAMALGSRPTVPTGVSIRVWGGPDDTTKPSWFIAGDYRDVFV